LADEKKDSKKKLAPIIIKKKKAGHAGAHGGAWKVAYADFVTAMMCFFLVMWLMGSDEETKSAVSNYFNNPTSALRPDLTSQETMPLGDRTGAGDEVLKGAGGAVPEDMSSKPQRPVAEGNSQADDPADVAQSLISSGDRIQVDVMRFSIAESELFRPGSTDQWTPQAPLVLQKVGKLAKSHKGRIQIRGTFGEETGSYDFQVSRAVSVSKYIVSRHYFPEEKIQTQIKRLKAGKDSDGVDREPASGGPRIEFIFTR
jgi:chemotaxis protein MotB